MELLLRTFLIAALLQGCLPLEGHQVFSITARTYRQLQAAKDIQKELGKEVEVWPEAIFLNEPALVQVSPYVASKFEDYIQKHGLYSEVAIENLAEAVNDQVARRTALGDDVLATFTFDEYHPLEEIEEWLFAIAAANPDITEIITVGASYELHPIFVLRVSLDINGTRPAIWMDGGIHAREWLAPATIVYFIDTFLKNYTTDSVLSKSLETHDWYFMPVFNVDGYNFTWIEAADENGTVSMPNRLWRGTRTPIYGQADECRGADPNRNWDKEWGTTTGVTLEPCGDDHLIYCGDSPWSEPSVRRVAFYLRDQIDLDVYFAYHMYGQMYMLPYGYKEEKPEDYDEMIEICQRGIARIKEVHGTDYRCGTLIDLVGPNSGSSVDWTYGELGVKYSFAVELRQNATYGFTLPADQILPNCEENWPFVLEVVESFMDGPSSAASSLSSLSFVISATFLVLIKNIGL